jgi:hypothetical protein
MVRDAEKYDNASFHDGCRVGLKRFMPLFLINILLGLPQAALSLPGVIALLWLAIRFLAGLGGLIGGEVPSMEAMQVFAEVIGPVLLLTIACFLPLLCMAWIIGLILGILNELAARSCVIEDLGVIASIKRGWQLGSRNLGLTSLNFIVLLVARLIYGFVAGLPATILMIPAGMGLLRDGLSPVVVASIIGLILYGLVIGWGVGGILTSLNVTIWTKLYLAFLGPNFSGIDMADDAGKFFVNSLNA